MTATSRRRFLLMLGAAGAVATTSGLAACGSGDDDAAGEERGRLYLSPEQLDLLGADTLIVMQSKLVVGEDDAIAAMADDPVWSQLPAVVSGDVITIDRLGYPGIAGRRRLVDDLVAQLG